MKMIEYISKRDINKIVVFGTGSAAVQTVVQLGIFYDKIDYFIDNNTSRQSTLLFGKVVNEPNILEKESLEGLLIIIASSWYKDISLELEKMGFINDTHFIVSDVLQIVDINYETTQNREINGVKVGKYSYGYAKCCYKGSIVSEIGSFCSINESARIGEVNHPLTHITTHPILYTARDEIMAPLEGVPGFIDEKDTFDIYSISSNEAIVIENDVWIGAHAIILPNVTIHNGAVVAAGAVVTKDVPPYAIVGGVPAKVIKYRYNPEEIEILLKVKWWEWSEEQISENVELLKKPELFFEKYRP